MRSHPKTKKSQLRMAREPHEDEKKDIKMTNESKDTAPLLMCLMSDAEKEVMQDRQMLCANVQEE